MKYEMVMFAKVVRALPHCSDVVKSIKEICAKNLFHNAIDRIEKVVDPQCGFENALYLLRSQINRLKTGVWCGRFDEECEEIIDDSLCTNAYTVHHLSLLELHH